MGETAAIETQTAEPAEKVSAPDIRRGTGPIQIQRRGKLLNIVKQVKAETGTTDHDTSPLYTARKPKALRRIGIEGHTERWLGRRFFIKNGETIEDAVKRQRKSKDEIEHDLIRVGHERTAKRNKIKSLKREATQQARAEDAWANNPPTRDELEDKYLMKPISAYQAERGNHQKNLRKFVFRNIEAISAAALVLATGYFYEKVGKDGKKRIYTAPPDKSMVMYLIDQAFDRPAIKRKDVPPKKSEPSEHYKVTRAAEET